VNQILFQILVLFSRLPLKVLYFFSDVFSLLNYYIIGYRKKVVFENLKNSFPEKTEPELRRIQKEFFRNFGDFMVETLKAFTISSEELEKLVTYENLDFFEKAYLQKKNVIILTGHTFNWEFTTLFAQKVPQENFYAIYKKLQSEFWDKKIIESRGRFGFSLLESKEVMRHFITQENDGNSVYGFLSDQSPSWGKSQFGVTFLNQKTPVLTGYNRIPRKDNFLYCFAEIVKIKRGKYHIKFIEILPENEKFEEHELVIKFNQYLERTIRKQPENWLWSHKRWKNADQLTDEILYQGKKYEI
jgi:KDO2-lipid IV(A) lauroyltransferase